MKSNHAIIILYSGEAPSDEAIATLGGYLIKKGYAIAEDLSILYKDNAGIAEALLSASPIKNKDANDTNCIKSEDLYDQIASAASFIAKVTQLESVTDAIFALNLTKSIYAVPSDEIENARKKLLLHSIMTIAENKKYWNLHCFKDLHFKKSHLEFINTLYRDIKQ